MHAWKQAINTAMPPRKPCQDAKCNLLRWFLLMNIARKPPTAQNAARICRIQWYLTFVSLAADGIRELLLENIKIASNMKKPN